MTRARALAAVLLALLTAVAAGGCKTFFHLDPLRDISTFYPLAVGNRWVYVDSSGTEHEDILADHIGEYFYNPKTRMGTSHDRQGIRQAVFYKGVARSNWYLIRVPLTIGAIWSSDNLLYEITNTHKTILVRAGTFHDCLEVRVRYKREFVTNREKGTVEAVITITFAPNVGPVEWRTTIGSHMIYRKELVSYQVG